ncbi:MAG TPA: HAD hydrolase family protein, partial [Candidatus Nanoarchaeia archaeon]|nr:HAD hydrolase family protein [Candidatus Nanoarchaeia archaeon]
ELKKVKHRDIKGFEPKEFIITLHCKKRVAEIEKIVGKYRNLYVIWNGDAYDIGIKKVQTKALGLRRLIKLLGIRKNNVLALGDNFNDREMLEEAGISISADKSRLKGDFCVPLNGKFLPADLVMQKIIQLKTKI